MIVSKRKIIKYFLVFLLMAFSGNPFFDSPDVSKIIFVTITFLLMIVYYRKFSKLNESKNLYIFILFFLGIFTSHFVVLGYVSVPGVIGFILKLIFGYLIIESVGNSFNKIYFNIIFYISVISLVGYCFTDLMGYDIPALFQDEKGTKSIVLFTQRFNTNRNSGMFWEPGAFAAYIILGFLLHLGKLKLLFKSNRLKVLLITIALMTTYSTTGYLLLFLIFLTSLIIETRRKNLILYSPLIILFIYLGFKVYNETEFLKEKIISQYESAIEVEGEFRPDRFGALFFDWYYIKKHPLIGNGLHEETRYSDHPELMGEKLGHGNGFSNFVASMGVLSLLFYSFYIIKWKKDYQYIFLVFVFLLLQGEPLMNFPLFLSIPFILLFSSENKMT